MAFFDDFDDIDGPFQSEVIASGAGKSSLSTRWLGRKRQLGSSARGFHLLRNLLINASHDHTG
jgi:hypothetical protein